MNDQAEKRVWRFGDYRLDEARRELSRGDEEIDVQPRVFALLVYLVRHHERAVDKDELQDAVWPGMFITETALTRAVMKARKAVGDDAGRQGVIKTVHGHGYRFVAELLPGPEDAAETGEPTAQPEPAAPADPALASSGSVSPGARPGRMSGIRIAIATLVLVIVVVLAWKLSEGPAEPAPGTRIAVLPLTDHTGSAELAWTRLGLMSYVSGLVGSEGGLPVVPDGSVVSLAENLGWSGDLGDADNAELVEKLRSVYGASHVLAMELVSDGGALRMNFALLGPGGTVQRGTMVGDEGTALAQGVVESVYGSLLGRRHGGRDVPAVSADPFNNEAFARGMDLSLQGRCAEAVQFFRLIIEQEPGLFAPRFEYASCLRLLGRTEEAEDLLVKLVAEQRAIGPGRPLAEALMTLGVLYNRSGRLDQAESAHREALEAVKAVQDSELEARILQNLSIVYEDRADFDKAEEILDLAVLAYQSAGREVMPGQLYSGKANLCMDRGELAEARGYLDQALQAFREVGDRRGEAMMLNNSGYLLREMGRLEEAESYHLRSLEIRKNIGDRVGVGRVYGQLSALYSEQGRYEEASQAAQSAVGIATETRDRLFEGTSLAQWAGAEVGLGDTRSARGHYEQSRAVFEDIDDRMRILQVDVLLARVDLHEGALDQADETARRVLTKAREASLMQPEIEAMELLGEVATARGDTAGAIREYTSALARVRESSWSGKEGDITVSLLHAHLDAGDLDSAAPLAGALASLEPTVDSLKARARYASASGDKTQAVALMEQAKVLADTRWDAQSEASLAQYRQP
ncbi:MAG: tetratricopeptide repeat protein [Lysobacterales bacterium]